MTVNPVLEAEQYPLPHIEDLFAGLKKFSKIYLNQAYLQMHVEEKSRELLTITTHKGLYRYCRLPFGITSAPAVFQRAMDQILSGLSGSTMLSGRHTCHRNNRGGASEKSGCRAAAT